MRRILLILLIIILVVIALVSIFFINKDQKEEYEQECIFEEIANIANTNTQQNEINKEKNTINIKELYEKNNDLVAWIKIENTNINYPVMQTKENPNYYLRRNFYKEYSILGTPYMAESCNIEKSDNLIIYGHNINYKKMFGELENYKEKEYYSKHKVIKFYTMQEEAEYEIIAVFKTIAYKGFEYYKFYNAKNKAEFDAFIAKCKELSIYNIENSVEYGDKLLTLSTCEHSNENGRLVIVAKKY